MFKVIDELNPEYMAVAFDLKAPTARHKLYEGYKATRKGMPNELAEQMPILKEILELMHITIIEKEGKKVGVINLIGRTDMNVLSENPFLIVDSILEKIKNNVDIIIVDFHAEATAEKIAMRYYLDGKISALFGTHTHVQTADEMILEKGTGYITDLGMTGPIKSIIGMDIDVSIKRFVTSLPEKYKLATGEYCLNGCLFEIDVESKKTTKITRINM